MKIGIITYYDIVNYGSAWLAYAMEKFFESYGHEVQFLQYIRKKENIIEKRTIYQMLRRYSPNARRSREIERIKNLKFKEFRDNYLTEGMEYHLAKGIDLLVIGSDQIFDCKYEFNDYQFGIHAPCDKVISYAPSFGEFHFEDLKQFDRREELQKALTSFKAHSFRDKNTANIIEALTGKKPVEVLDPVLMYGFEREKDIWNQRLIEEDYLIVYAWGGTTINPEFAEAVQKFALKHNLKTVSIGDRRLWCDYDFSTASPIEFFELYRNCSMVITNMFHGTCFSVLNEKPFYSLVMPHNKNKLGGLLQILQLESQIMLDVRCLENAMIPNIDYERVNDLLALKRKSSISYLENMI